MNMYKVEKGKVISEDKIPYPPRWFADNRIAFQVDEQGLGDIDYYNSTTKGHYKAFLNSFWGGMRFFVNNGVHNHLLRFNECEILPFGIKGRCITADASYELSIYVAEDTIFIVLKTGEIVPSKTKFKAEFYKAYCMQPQGLDGDLRYKSHINRDWVDFELKNNRLLGGFTEEASTTGICFGSNYKMSFEQSRGNIKYTLSSPEICENNEYVLAISFDTSIENALTRCEHSIKTYDTLLEKQNDRYNNVAEKAPVLISPYEQLNNFVAFAPLYHESLKITDVPGAIRAQTTHYWVWGWDSMTSNEATCYWGDKSFIAAMLDCFEKYADEQAGVAHAFSRDMSCGDEAPAPAQGMYITILYLHYTNGGSITAIYPFAKRLFKKILDSEVNSLGLCGGTSLYPDYRSLINETGNDISAFNNTVSYCAIRSMEAMANYVGDMETAKTARDFGKRLRDNFLPVLFNKTQQFIDSSADSVTFETRNVLGNNAVKWENNFCSELLDEISEECMEFYLKNLVSPAGLMPIAPWCDTYNSDSNQLSCWWLVMVEFYGRLINQFDNVGQIEQLTKWISYWTEKLMCPEGISCYDETDTPSLDNWNCLNGIWQAYSLRGWYATIVHNIVGVDLDEGGLTVYPYSGKEMQLLGLHFGEKTFDINMCGSGPFVQSIEVNGITVLGTNKVPYDMLLDKNKIVVYRGDTQACFCNIKKAYGIKISEYSYTNEMIIATINGSASGECVLYSSEPIEASVNDLPLEISQDKDGNYKIQFNFYKAQITKLTCKKGKKV